MQHIITNTYQEKLIFTSLEGIRWKISKGLREEWWIELMREGGVLSLHPWIYCSEFQICFCMIWFQYFDFSYQFVNILQSCYYFSSIFPILCRPNYLYEFLGLCTSSLWNFSKFFYSFLYKIPIWFLYSCRSSRLRQTKGEWTLFISTTAITLSAYSIIYYYFFLSICKKEIESRKIPFHAG